MLTAAISTGEALLAAAAFLAAFAALFVAPRTALSRLREQRAHDRDGLREQLAHDRTMRDRDELRMTLDEAARAINAAIIALTEAELANDDACDATDAIEKADLEREAKEKLGAARVAIGAISPANSRLRLRLPRDHPVLATHWEVRTAIWGWANQLASRSLSRIRSDHHARETSAGPVRTSLDAFLAACKAHLDEV